MRERARDAGNQLLAVVHQRMVDQQLLIGARADGLADGLALSAPHHRTDAQALLIGIHVGNGEIGLEGAHLAALVFARQKLEAVLAGRKREAGVVLDVPAGKLRGVLAHFDLDGVAHVALDLSVASVTWPTKSNSVVSPAPRRDSAISLPAILTATGTK